MDNKIEDQIDGLAQAVSKSFDGMEKRFKEFINPFDVRNRVSILVSARKIEI